MKTKGLVGLLVLLAVGASTGFGAKLVSSWVTPEVREVKFSKILAMAVTGSLPTRRLVEGLMAEEIAKRGVIGQTTYALMPNLNVEYNDALREKIASTGADGAVVLELESYNEKERSITSPNFDRYRFWAFPRRPADTFTFTDVTVDVDVQVYSLKYDLLMWQGVVRFSNPESEEKEISELADIVVRAMEKKDLLAK